MRVVKNTGLL